MRKKNRFIMIDGLTGSGKSTVINTMREWITSRERRVFNLKDWNGQAPPMFNEINDFDVYFTHEPTRHWVGAAIRAELSRVDAPYGGEEIAHAFALDREIMYKRLILPALEDGKTVIQDRGVTSSIVYQPVMKNGLTLEQILALPGNALALKHAPDYLILTRLPAQVAYERIKIRAEESKGVFADLEFLKQQEERYASQWFRELFEKNGTSVLALDTSLTLEEVKQNAKQIIGEILHI
jgi:dTMP kinase